MNFLARPRAVRFRVALACGVLASLLVGGGAAAQFGPIILLPPGLPTVMPAPTGGYPPTVASTAAGPYYAPPVWSQALATNVRFMILSNFNGDAVLDRATGLVWARTNAPIAEVALNAEIPCMYLTIGSRMGWRLPSISELQSLLDLSLPSSGQPKLPVGHPFMLPSTVDGNLFFYWTTQITTSDDQPVRLASDMSNGLNAAFRIDDFNRELGALCVRGAQRAR